MKEYTCVYGSTGGTFETEVPLVPWDIFFESHSDTPSIALSVAHDDVSGLVCTTVGHIDTTGHVNIHSEDTRDDILFKLLDGKPSYVVSRYLYSLSLFIE